MSILPTLDGGTLGPDMMFEIFLRSSMDCLGNLSRVSKNWETFLGDPYFNKLYYKTNPEKQTLAVPVFDNKLVILEETNPPILSDQKLPLECKGMKMIGSCDGLVGFIHSSRGFLWNPVSKLGKTFDLPPLLTSRRHVISISTGLGYDFSRHDYKFVLLVSSDETRISLYSSRNDSWSDLPIVPFSPQPDSNSKFILNNIPYWVGKDTKGRQVVFNFDPTSESYGLIPYPTVDESRTVYVVRFGEFIAGLAYSPLDHTVDVFLHQEEEVWVRVFASIGPIQNNFDVKIMQHFKETIISWASPSNMSFYNREPLLLISELMNPLQPRVDESYYHFKSMVRVTGAGCYYPKSVGEVFRDYKRRRLSLIRALTTESKMFCQLCELYGECFPESAGIRIRVYGLPDDWSVGFTSAELPARQGPGELPEPLWVINLAKSSMEVSKWLCSIARSCDFWLVAVAFHMAASFGFDRANRKRLFLLINDLPTVYEVVRGHQKQLKEETFLLDK